MYQENTKITARDPYDLGARDLVSFPSSVQDRLDQAGALLSAERAPDAFAMLEQAGAELARRQPEMLGLMVASQMGYRQVAFDHVETTTEKVETERRLFGIRVGTDVTVTTKNRLVRRTARLS